jgi:myo-inositol 2-dehydrogenase/D-chiro-inositol 1-dehydrogenase
VIATPEDSHRALAVPALTKGIAVLCEKPIARLVEDADEMIAAARAHDVLLAIGHTTRFDPRYRTLWRVIESGELGEAVEIVSRRASNAAERDFYGLRTSLAMELAVHDLDVFHWFAGHIERVYAECAAPSAGESPGALAATVRFASGAIGLLEASWAYPPECGINFESYLAFVGTDGVAVLSDRAGALALNVRSGGRLIDPLDGPQLLGAPVNALAHEVDFFFACIREGLAWPLDAVDARRALIAARALEASIERGSPISLPSEKLA